MLHFFNQADHQLYLKALSAPETGEKLQQLVDRKVRSGDEPRSLLLAPTTRDSEMDANGVPEYFDWLWLRTPYDDDGRPVNIQIGVTDLRPYRIMNGGFMLKNGEWSSHS